MALYKKGESGNPAGKAKGTLSKITRLKNHLLDIGEERIEEIRTMPIHLLVRCLASIMPKDVNIDITAQQIVVNINKTIAQPTATPDVIDAEVVDSTLDED